MWGLELPTTSVKKFLESAGEWLTPSSHIDNREDATRVLNDVARPYEKDQLQQAFSRWQSLTGNTNQGITDFMLGKDIGPKGDELKPFIDELNKMSAQAIETVKAGLTPEQKSKLDTLATHEQGLRGSDKDKILAGYYEQIAATKAQLDKKPMASGEVRIDADVSQAAANQIIKTRSEANTVEQTATSVDGIRTMLGVDKSTKLFLTIDAINGGKPLEFDALDDGNSKSAVQARLIDNNTNLLNGFIDGGGSIKKLNDGTLIAIDGNGKAVQNREIKALIGDINNGTDRSALLDYKAMLSDSKDTGLYNQPLADVAAVLNAGKDGAPKQSPTQLDKNKITSVDQLESALGIRSDERELLSARAEVNDRSIDAAFFQQDLKKMVNGLTTTRSLEENQRGWITQNEDTLKGFFAAGGYMEKDASGKMHAYAADGKPVAANSKIGELTEHLNAGDAPPKQKSTELAGHLVSTPEVDKQHAFASLVDRSAYPDLALLNLSKPGHFPAIENFSPAAAGGGMNKAKVEIG